MFGGMVGRQGSRDIMKEKRQKEVKGLKKNHSYIQTLIADTLTCSGKFFLSVLSQRQPLHSILLLDIPETELHPKPREIRLPCFYVLVDGSQYDCHKCRVLKS